MAGRRIAFRHDLHLQAPARELAVPDAVEQISSNRADTFGAVGATTAQYERSAVTPIAGVVFKPWRHVSLYANHVGGLSKGDSAPDTAVNAGKAFAP